MRKITFYPHLAVTNVLRNNQFYLPYLLTNIATVAMFYILAYLSFDDTLASRNSHPALTTVHQDPGLRARTAIDCLEALKQGRPCPGRITLPVELMIRESTRSVSCPIL